MLVVEILSPDVHINEVRGKKDPSRTYKFREQQGRVSFDGEVRKIRVRLGDEQEPWPVGRYQLSEESFSVGSYGDLGLRNLVLRPVK